SSGPYPSPPILVQSELRAEVNPFDLLVGGEAVGGSTAENHPIMHDIGAIRNPERFPHVVVCNQHTNSALLEVKDDLLNVRDGNRVDPGERLIEQHEFRRDH